MTVICNGSKPVAHVRESARSLLALRAPIQGENALPPIIDRRQEDRRCAAGHSLARLILHFLDDGRSRQLGAQLRDLHLQASLPASRGARIQGRQLGSSAVSRSANSTLQFTRDLLRLPHLGNQLVAFLHRELRPVAVLHLVATFSTQL